MKLQKVILTAIFFLSGFVSIKAQDDSIMDSEVASPLQYPHEGIQVSGTLAVIHIETENHQPITSKTVYINAKYWIIPCGNNDYEALGSESKPLDMQIRGRGHSSWNSPKKPYKIKLSDKLSLLGMPKNKHWALLKPSEATVAGLRLGEIIDMAWTPHYRPIEVVLNGINIGLYFLTETIRIDKNRVNIFEQRDSETDSDLISGGWLVEIDNYLDDNQITIKENAKWNLTLKYHSPEDLSSAQLKWLTNEFTNINKAIYSSNKSSVDWENYLDIESMAKFFIIQEIMDNPDGFHGSFYLHKDLGDNTKWVAGPIWDLVCYNREKTDYTFNMKVHYTITPHWIREIIQYENFCKMVNSVWQNIYPEKLSEIYDYIDQNFLPLENAWNQNQKIWEDDPYLSVSERVENIKNALKRNIEWLNNHLPQTASLTTLPSETKTGYRVFNLQGTFIGEFENEKDLHSTLKNGLYIINGIKVLINH